jgi:release factor glutamine methyltransferase
VPTKIARALLADGRGEPLGALDGGEDGLALIRTLVSQAPKHLVHGGRLLIEIDQSQAEVRKKFRLAGFEKIEVFKDLQGTPRVLCGLQS